MRFGKPVPFLPVGYPKDIYSKGKSKLVRKKLKLSVHHDTKLLLRHIAGLLPPSFFSDPNIFPVDPAVLVKIATGGQTHADPIHNWVSGGYLTVPENGRVVLYRGTGGGSKKLCEGSSGFVLEYIVSYCVAALTSFVAAHRAGVMVCEEAGQFGELLKAYRRVRAKLRGLDRISKVDELRAIDQDSTICKFPVEPEWFDFENTVCYHLGSGVEYSSSQRALWMYDQVILVDPLLTSESPVHRPVTWDKVWDEIPPEADIVSDVAYGDEWGMVVGLNTLAQKMYARSATSLNIIKLTLEEGYPGIKGRVLSKVRPHNSEVVVRLDPEGEDLDKVFNSLREKVILANELRNAKIYRHEFDDVIKPCALSSSELGRLMRRKPRTLLPPTRYTRWRPTPAGLYIESIQGEKLRLRQKRWRRICREPKLPDCQYVILPNTYHVYPGYLVDQDPLFGDVNVSFRSLVETAKHNGMSMHYDGTNWTLI